MTERSISSSPNPANLQAVPLQVPSEGRGGENANTERAFKDVLVELWGNTETLVRQEASLAKAEFELKANKIKDEVKTEAMALAAGGALLFAGLLGIVAAAILLLNEVMAAWVAALLVGAVLIAIGYALTKRKTKITAADMKPSRTMRSVREDAHTFREATK